MTEKHRLSHFAKYVENQEGIPDSLVLEEIAKNPEIYGVKASTGHVCLTSHPPINVTEYRFHVPISKDINSPVLIPPLIEDIFFEHTVFFVFNVTNGEEEAKVITTELQSHVQNADHDLLTQEFSESLLNNNFCTTLDLKKGQLATNCFRTAILLSYNAHEDKLKAVTDARYKNLHRTVDFSWNTQPFIEAGQRLELKIKNLIHRNKAYPGKDDLNEMLDRYHTKHVLDHTDVVYVVDPIENGVQIHLFENYDGYYKTEIYQLTDGRGKHVKTVSLSTEEWWGRLQALGFRLPKSPDLEEHLHNKKG